MNWWRELWTTDLVALAPLLIAGVVAAWLALEL